MSGDTEAMNSVNAVSSASESLKPEIEQGHDLDPEPARVERANGVEDRLQPSAQLAVLAVIETLQVDFVEIDPGRQVVENL